MIFEGESSGAGAIGRGGWVTFICPRGLSSADTNSLLNSCVQNNETNNALEKTFVWKGADLTVTDIQLEPAVPLITEGKLIATIANIGTYDTANLLNIDVKVYLDGVECDTGLVIAGLDAGDELIDLVRHERVSSVDRRLESSSIAASQNVAN